MIVDLIANAGRYVGLGDRLARAFALIRDGGLASLPAGTHEIDGRGLYVAVHEYTTKRQEDASWEAHRRYIDLQCVLTGVERIGYAPADAMTRGPYDDARDYEVLSGDGEFVTLRPGSFALLWPGEAHMPGVVSGMPVVVRKAVVKIAATG